MVALALPAKPKVCFALSTKAKKPARGAGAAAENWPLMDESDIDAFLYRLQMSVGRFTPAFARAHPLLTNLRNLSPSEKLVVIQIARTLGPEVFLMGISIETIQVELNRHSYPAKEFRINGSDVMKLTGLDETDGQTGTSAPASTPNLVVRESVMTTQISVSTLRKEEGNQTVLVNVPVYIGVQEFQMALLKALKNHPLHPKFFTEEKARLRRELTR